MLRNKLYCFIFEFRRKPCKLIGNFIFKTWIIFLNSFYYFGVRRIDEVFFSFSSHVFLWLKFFIFSSVFLAVDWWVLVLFSWEFSHFLYRFFHNILPSLEPELQFLRSGDLFLPLLFLFLVSFVLVVDLPFFTALGVLLIFLEFVLTFL